MGDEIWRINKMKYEIIAIREGKELDEEGKPYDVMKARFRVGKWGTFTVEMPKKEFTKAKMLKKIEKLVAEVKGVVEEGMEGT